MSDTITIMIHGIPRPGGSKRGFAFKRKGGGIGVSLVDASGEKGKDWRGDVKAAAIAKMRDDSLDTNTSGALSLTVGFHMPRPKSHFRKNGELKPDAPHYHTSKPDTTKLLRSLEDALTGILWNDDAQIAVQSAVKLYMDPVSRFVGAELTLKDITKGA